MAQHRPLGGGNATRGRASSNRLGDYKRRSRSRTSSLYGITVRHRFREPAQQHPTPSSNIEPLAHINSLCFSYVLSPLPIFFILSFCLSVHSSSSHAIQSSAISDVPRVLSYHGHPNPGYLSLSRVVLGTSPMRLASAALTP